MQKMGIGGYSVQHYMNKCCNAIFLVTLITASGCIKVEIKELPGKYVFNQGNTRDTLLVLSNGRYQHTAYINNKRQSNVGNWKFNGVEMKFHNFTFFNGGNGLWISRVFKEKDRIMFNYADEEVFYSKLK